MSKHNKLVNSYTVKKTRPNVIIGPNVHKMSNDTTKKISNTQTINKETNDDVNKCFNEIENKYKTNLEHYWQNRTNVPYKKILYDQDYSKKITKEDDLILCNVKAIDKIQDDQIDNYKNNLEKHNNELKIIYSVNKKAEHYKQFEYNHKHKYRLANLPSASQNELKGVSQNFYDREKQKEENDRRHKEKLLNSILNN